MDLYDKEDTICAIATPLGEGGIGIIKISGPEALSIALKIFHPTLFSASTRSLESHRLYHGWIRDPASRQPVDEVLVSYMAAPRSYTRENVIEINSHSGYAVLNRILQLTLEAGARLAEPGEFTRRAFLNGRIDLSQAEAVIEVIHSQSQQSLTAANRQLQGDLRNQVERWRDQLLQLQSELEASMDFAEDMEESAEDFFLQERLEKTLIRPLEKVLDDYEEGKILREGLSLVLVGKPNVGKSSLLNALVGKDRVIVTPFPGTTRDVIQESFLLSGILVRILDTAGIHQKPDEIEAIGIDKTLRCVEEADIILWLLDQSRPLSEEDDLIFGTLGSACYMILLNKVDLPSAVSIGEVQERYGGTHPVLRLSVLNPSDVERLRNHLIESYLRTPLEMDRSAIIPNLRQKGCLERALNALHRAEELLGKKEYPELVALEFQTARQELESIVGWNAGEDLLDRIFSQFCIGK
jgi:tRNA modification GTPase